MNTLTLFAADNGNDLFSASAWQQIGKETIDWISKNLPNAAAALAVLIVGWLVAVVVAAVVRGVIRRLGLNNRLAKLFAAEKGEEAPDVAAYIGRLVFWLLMLFVLVAFFQTLQLTVVTQPLTAFLEEVFGYAPRIIAAGILLVIAWIVATVLRFVVRTALTTVKLDRRLSRQADVDGEEDLPMTRALSEATYWLVFLLFLPAVLSTLQIPGLLTPVQGMVTQVLGFLPKLLAAAVILAVGWFVARIVQRIVANLLAAVGANEFGESVGLTAVMGKKKLSDVVALLLYFFILVPVIISAIDALQIEGVTQPARQMLTTILDSLPGIFAAALVIAVAYVAARVVSSLVANVLASIGFDRLPARLGLGGEPEEGKRTPSQIAGTLIFVAAMLFATMQALPLLGFDLLASLMAEFMVFGGKVLLGLAIVALGLYLANLAARTIEDAEINHAKLLSILARVSILGLAGAMALQQMIPDQRVVLVAFGLVLGAVAVAAAIAFGIGGRDAAKDIVDDFFKKRRPTRRGG